MDVTLDDVLTMLDEHYNNIKALDALNQELFQLQMGKNGDSVRLWGTPFQTPPGPCSLISQQISARPSG